MQFDLENSTALVTGASRGIGRAIALGLARAGADVVGLARSREALVEVGGEVASFNRSFLPLVTDLADADAARARGRNSLGMEGWCRRPGERRRCPQRIGIWRSP